MGKFGANRSGRSGGFNRGGGDGERRSEGRSGGSRGGYSRGGRGSSKKGDSIKVGDLSISDKMLEEVGIEMVDDLRNSNVSLYVKVYPPKGVDEIVLRRGDYINVQLCKSKYGGERTVGFMSASSDEE